MGMALRAQGREAQALGYFLEALRLNPNYGPALEIMEKIGKERKVGEDAS
jgi:hypothetical protein